jgi:hypothetical protein
MIIYFIRGIELLQGKPCSFFMIRIDIIVMAAGVWPGELLLKKGGKL